MCIIGSMSNTENTVHKFEAAGLGKAPFKFVGMERQNIRDVGNGVQMAVTTDAQGFEIMTKPGGTCAFCGTYIRHMFNVESADGQRFHVGCDCLEHTGDAGFKKIISAHKKALAAKARKARLVKESARIEAAQEALQSGKLDAWADMAHPRGREGASLKDYALWMMENAGHAGKMKVARNAEKLLRKGE